LIFRFILITSHRAVVFTLTTKNLKRSITQQTLAAKRFEETSEGAKQTRNQNRRILKKLKMIMSLSKPETGTPKTLPTITLCADKSYDHLDRLLGYSQSYYF
jgi:hypothetical protein